MNPVLFLLMRTDLVSMNPGKACAQAAHAANALEHHYLDLLENTNTNDDLVIAYDKWQKQTSQGFGTTIVLGGEMETIKVDIAHLTNTGFLAGVVHDPTYPLKDGSVTHLIPLDTCAYVFAPNKDDPALRVILDNYELHP